jgi:hypothetical protein
MKAIITNINNHFLVLLIPIFLVGCKSTSESISNTEIRGRAEELVEEIKEMNGTRYIVNEPLFQIVELSTVEQPFGPYYYKISTPQKLFVEGINTGEPKITNIGEGIVKLFQAFGSNTFSVQYFDVWFDRTSEELSLYSTPADYVNSRING